MNHVKPSSSAQSHWSEAPLGFEFDPRELLGIVLKHKWLIVGVTAVVTLGVLLWTLRQPEIYAARCTLQYDPSPPRPLGSEIEDLTQGVNNPWLAKEYYETQNRIIASRAVAEQVVRKLALHKDASFFGVPEQAAEGWGGATVTQAAEVLRGKLDVEHVEDTRLVTVSVEDTDPKRAQLLANTLAETYIEKTLDDRMGSSVTALEWLSAQLDSLRQQLEKSEIALYDFKQKNNVLSVALEERQNIVANEIERYTEALASARTRRIELAARLEQLRAANRDNPLEVHSSIIDGHGPVQELRDAHRTKATALSALALRYGANHPQMRELAAELQSITTQLRKEIDGVILSAEADLAEAKAIETGVRSALEAANKAGLDLNLQEIEYQQLNRKRANHEKLYGILLERTAETNLSRMLRVTNVGLVDRALLPKAAIRPRTELNVGFGAFGGLVFGLLLAFGASRLDRTLKSAEDVESLGIPLLGVLPQIEPEGGRGARKFGLGGRNRRADPVGDDKRDLIVHAQPRSTAAECCRTIRTNLTFMGAEQALEAFVVTSAGPREGKTTVAVSLAIAIAQSGKRVLLVDTDMRRPRLHRVFRASSAVGMTSLLVGESTLVDCVQPTDIPGLSLLPCGPIPPNPSELLHTPRFREFVEEARQRFDRVLFDSPPLGAVTDAAVVAPQVDGVLTVVRMRETSRDAAAAAVRQLRDVGAHIVGAVLNHVDSSTSGYRYGGYYYYQRGNYYQADDVDASYSTEPRQQV